MLEYLKQFGACLAEGGRNQLIAVLVAGVLLFIHPTLADVPCLEQPVIVDYDGCLLPDDPANEDPWSTDPGSNGMPYIDSCQLVIPVSDEHGYHGYRRYEESLQDAQAYSMEARLRAEDVYLPGTSANASFGVSDGLKSVFVTLTHNTITGETWVIACGEEECASLQIDWTGYHVFSLEVRKGDEARFFVDGQLLHAAAYDSLRDTNLPPNLSVFGGAESVSCWDFVRYEVCSSAAPEDLPPVAQAVSHVTVAGSEWVQLDGSASYDPEEQPLTYQWAQTAGTPVTLDDPTSPTPGFQAPSSTEPQRLGFQLVVSDGLLESQPALVTVEVRPAPDAPVAVEEQAENTIAEAEQLEIPRVFRRVPGSRKATRA